MKNVMPEIQYIPDTEEMVDISPVSLRNFVSFLGTCSHLLAGEWTAHLGGGGGRIRLVGKSPKGDKVDVLFRPDGSLDVGYILPAMVGSTSYGIWDGKIPKVFAEIMEGKKNGWHYEKRHESIDPNQ